MLSSLLLGGILKIPGTRPAFYLVLPRFRVSHIQRRAGHSKTLCDHPPPLSFASWKKIINKKIKSANCSVVSFFFLDFTFLSWSPPWIGEGVSLSSVRHGHPQTTRRGGALLSGSRQPDKSPSWSAECGCN